MNKLKILLFVTLLTTNFKALAQIGLELQKKEIQTYLELIKTAQYQEAIDSLSEVDEKAISLGDRAYFLGIGYSRLQQFDEAINQFKIALKNNCSFKDLQYEYGQALFGGNQIKAARDAFKLSLSQDHNPIASLYYIAYTSELLEEFHIAKFYYVKLIKDKRVDHKILQVSFFRYTKIQMDLMKKEDRKLKRFDLEELSMRNVPRYIIPLLKKTVSIDPNSDIASEATQLLGELEKEYFLDPNLLLNGKKLSSTRYYSYLNLGIKYDNNYASTKRGATSYEGSFYYKYDFTAKKRFIISPDFRIDFTRYKNQDESLFYEYDSYAVSTSLKNRFEHRLLKKQASLSLNLDYSKNYRDLDGNHQKKPAYQTFGYSLGETFNLLSAGDTTIRVKNSHYLDARDSSSHSRTFSASLDQTAFLNQGQNLLLVSFDLSLVDNYNFNFSNYRSYSTRLTYIFFEVLPSYTLQMGYSLSITDPLKLREDRGYEISHNPSFEVSKELTSDISLSASYSFNSSKSKMEAYRGDKSNLASNLNISF